MIMVKLTRYNYYVLALGMISHTKLQCGYLKPVGYLMISKDNLICENAGERDKPAI